MPDDIYSQKTGQMESNYPVKVITDESIQKLAQKEAAFASNSLHQIFPGIPSGFSAGMKPGECRLSGFITSSPLVPSDLPKAFRSFPPGIVLSVTGASRPDTENPSAEALFVNLSFTKGNCFFPMNESTGFDPCCFGSDLSTWNESRNETQTIIREGAQINILHAMITVEIRDWTVRKYQVSVKTSTRG